MIDLCPEANGLYLQRAHCCYKDILRKISFTIWCDRYRILQNLFHHGSASYLLNCNKKQCCTSVDISDNNNSSRKEDIIPIIWTPKTYLIFRIATWSYHNSLVLRSYYSPHFQIILKALHKKKLLTCWTIVHGRHISIWYPYHHVFWIKQAMTSIT